MSKSKLTDQEKIYVCEEYQSGITSTVIGRKYGLSSDAILGILRRRNITIRSKAGGEARLRFKPGEPITCMDCGVLLTETNWRRCDRNGKHRYYICIPCVHKKSKIYWDQHKERRNKNSRIASRKLGIQPMSENRQCTMFLGVHVAERVLKNIFNDVEVMPINNIGYDFICNKGKKIDVKSSCMHKVKPNSFKWTFEIKLNTIADYFLCLAFDSRDDLNPLHMWLLPGHAINTKRTASISKTLMHKWDIYRLPVDKVISCCNVMKDNATGQSQI